MSAKTFDDYVFYATVILIALFVLYQCEQSSAPSVPRYDMIDCVPIYTQRGTQC